MGAALLLERFDSVCGKIKLRGPKWRATLSSTPKFQNTKWIPKMIMGREGRIPPRSRRELRSSGLLRSK
jgi:hypothetical protein